MCKEISVYAYKVRVLYIIHTSMYMHASGKQYKNNQNNQYNIFILYKILI